MNVMRRVTSSPGRALPGLLAVVVVFIVLGIAGMHALSTHGVMGTTEHSALASPMTGPLTGEHGGRSTGPASPAPGTHAGMSSTAPDGGDGHSLGSMVMLCFALLAATAGALLLVVLRRRPRVWAHHPTGLTTVTRWVHARLGTGPPYVWQFSVIRC